MSAIVQAVIAAELAKLSRVVSLPSDPLGYGSDLSCASDLDESMSETDPMSRVAIGQSIARSLDTPRGSAPDSPERGLSLRSYLNAAVSTDEIRSLASRVRSEVRADDRIDDATVSVELANGGSELTVSISVEAVDPRVGGFSLVLAVTSAEVVLKEIRA
jgi:phage baseplate assembly protein W